MALPGFSPFTAGDAVVLIIGTLWPESMLLR
jgi:hypothetical protein